MKPHLWTGCAAATPAVAWEPTKPIEIVAPFSAGGHHAATPRVTTISTWSAVISWMPGRRRA